MSRRLPYIAAIDEAISRIKDGSMARFKYDPASARFVAI